MLGDGTNKCWTLRAAPLMIARARRVSFWSGLTLDSRGSISREHASTGLRLEDAAGLRLEDAVSVHPGAIVREWRGAQM